jgi:tetratricopeptide (TPR) repeat protein
VNIEYLVNLDPELWQFPFLYHALEDGEVPPERFLQLLLSDLRHEPERTLRAQSVAQDGDLALASLLEYGDTEAIESVEFIFRSTQQEWWSLVTDEMGDLEKALQEYHADLPPELVKEIENEFSSAANWIHQYRYDRASRVLERCKDILDRGIKSVREGLRASQEISNLVVEDARNRLQSCTPLAAGQEAELLARQLLNRALDLTLARHSDFDEIERLAATVKALCELQQPDEELIEQARTLQQEGTSVYTPKVLETDEETDFLADQILREGLDLEQPLPQIDPLAWYHRRIHLDVGVGFIDKPVDLSLLLRTDMALCSEPENEKRVGARTRNRIYEEVGKPSVPSLKRDSDESEKLQRRADLYLRASKAALLSFPIRDPNAEQAKRIRDYLIGYCVLRGDYLFGNDKFEAARDYYREAFRLNPRHFDLGVAQRVLPFLRCLLPSPTKHDIKEASTSSLRQIGYWIEQVSRQVTASTAGVVVREILLLQHDHEQIQTAVEDLLSSSSSSFAQLCLAVARSINRCESDAPTSVAKGLEKLFQEQRQHLENSLEDLLNYANTPQVWTQAYELMHRILGHPALDDTATSILQQLTDLVREALSYADTPRFEDRDTLVRRMERHARHIGAEIAASPAFLARTYLLGYLFRLWQAIEAMHNEARIVAKPQFSFSIAKVHQLTARLYECHTIVANVGETTASQVKLDFAASGVEGITFGRCSPPLLNLAPGQTKTVSVPVEVGDLPTALEAIDADIGFEFIDRDREKHISQRRLRVDLGPSGEFMPISQTPYVTGGIVFDERVFVGRDELINSLIAEVALSPQTNAAVIFGQMRSGKSSILYYLQKRSPESVVPIRVSLQSVLVDSAQGDLVATLFDYIARELVEGLETQGVDIEEIEWETLTRPPGPAIQFERWLRRVREQTDLRPLILFDEFTELLDRIDEGRIPKEIMKKFKQLIEQGYFSCVISGIDQMAHALNRFANELMVSKPRWVGYLDETAARQLIEEPIRLPDGSNRFSSEEVISEIIHLTAANPYLIQIIGSRIVQYINDNRVVTFTGADLDRVIEGLIAETALALFHFLCRYREDPQFDDRDAVLEGLFLFLLADETQRTGYASLDAISQRAPFVSMMDFERLANALELRRVVEAVTEGGMQRYRIVVDLFQRWLATKRPMDSARLSGFKQRLEEYDAL